MAIKLETHISHMTENISKGLLLNKVPASERTSTTSKDLFGADMPWNYERNEKHTGGNLLSHKLKQEIQILILAFLVLQVHCSLSIRVLQQSSNDFVGGIPLG